MRRRSLLRSTAPALGVPGISALLMLRARLMAFGLLLFLSLSPPASAGEMRASEKSGAEVLAPQTQQPGSDRGVGTDAPRALGLTLPAVPEGFSVSDAGWIEIAYHPSLSAKVQVLREQAESVKGELSKLLGEPVLGKVYVRVGRTAGEMETLAPEGVGFPRYASGVAYSELGLVLLTAASRYPGERHDLAEVFRHELAHVALHDAVSRDRVPRWFNEGFAIHASGEAETARMQALWTASLSGNLIPFKKLLNSFPRDADTASVAYAQAADLVRFLLRGGEEHRFSALIRRLSAGQSFDAALMDAYATDMYSLEKDWQKDVSRRYTFWPVIFGGSLIWAAALGLLIWGYVRRRKRAQKKLDRWAREEALEDARRRWAESLASRFPLRLLEAVSEAPRPSLSESEPEQTEPEQKEQLRLAVTYGPIPSVEHDGERHTLH